MTEMSTVKRIEAARAAMSDLPEAGLDLLFRAAQTHHGWQDRPVPAQLLEQVLDLAKMGPTAFNQQPLRVIFVTTAEGKARLSRAMSRGNHDKTMAAPATAILCYDLEFWRNLPELWPQADVQGYYNKSLDAARESAQRNGTLQAGYFLMAARALGLDCGPMSGFDKAKVADAFLQGRPWEVNFLMNLGYGLPEKVNPRAPRLPFARMAEIV
jgi:nitroreductase